jgi:hypothetical protein
MRFCPTARHGCNLQTEGVQLALVLDADPAFHGAAGINTEMEIIMTRLKTAHNRIPTARRLVAASLIALAPFVANLPAHAVDTKASTDTKLQQVKNQSAQALEAMKNYTAAQRSDALAKGKELLDAMDTRIDQLELRTQSEWGQLSRQARERRQTAMHALRQQRDDVAQWYGGIRHGSAGAWDEVKQGFVDAYGTLSRSFGDAVAQFDADDTSRKQP